MAAGHGFGVLAESRNVAYDERSMYMLVIFVLSLSLAFPAPLYHVLTDWPAVMAAMLVAALLPPLLLIPCLWAARASLERHLERPDFGQALYSRSLLMIQILLGLLCAGLYVGSDWLALCGRIPVVGGIPGVAGIVSTLPFIFSVLLIWAISYPTERTLRQIGLEIALFRGRPVRPVWMLGDYLLFNFRTQVLITWIPMSLIVIARDLVDRYDDVLRKLVGGTSPRPGVAAAGAYIPDLLLGTVAMGVAVLAPAIIRYVWETRPLPSGPLRDKLMALCTRLRMRCREILVWRSGGRLVNAAVMGLIAPIRFILITDAMLEQMDDTKIEAVFGHEAGHVKRHHIFFFLLFAFITGCTVTIVSALRPHYRESTYMLIMGVTALALAVKWFLVFGWMSRRFERQADVYGVRTLMLAGLPCSGPCAVHAPSAERPGGDPLCRAAVDVFSATLNDVALLNGIPPEAPSWRHSSISSRSRFLQALGQDPFATQQFERLIIWIKRGVLAGAAISAIAAVYVLRLWTLLGFQTG